jgi:molybdopterin-guanine dinucleotide biosynthesis protein B
MSDASVFGIVGWKNSGKTTLMAKIIAFYAARGLKVAAIKHAHHGFEVDQEGRDSYRFREAGAATVAISSSARYAIMHELRGDPEPTLAELIAKAGSHDLFLVEGFKRESHQKLEVRRKDAIKQEPLAPSDPTIVAVAGDFPCEAGTLPFFSLDDIERIAAFIAGKTNLSHP